LTVQVRLITDPACPWSWSAEPVFRRLMVDFGDSLSWTYVMGGMARDYTQGQGDPGVEVGARRPVYPGLVKHWLDVADRGGMPLDPRIWNEGPIKSTYPACMAVKAAAEQAADGGYRYLRALREGLMCFRRKLDTTEALVEEARRARLDVERFRVDLGSHAIVEAFGSDLEEARAVPEEARAAGAVVAAGGAPERVAFPSVVFSGEDRVRHAVWGYEPSYERYREAAEAAGAVAGGSERPGVLDALRRFGPMATREVEEVCGLPGPRAPAELWRLAQEWQVRPVRVLTGHLWELA
jgi:predicted DsbA family dithiol-disulfide isomerase